MRAFRPCGNSIYSGNPIEEMSNAALKAEALVVVSEIRAIDKQAYDESENMRRGANDAQLINQIYQQERQAWDSLRARCSLIRDEMLIRLPDNPVKLDQMNAQIVHDTIDEGSIAGAYPLRTVATYMEELALSLPAKGSHPVHKK